ncbi:MAG: N-acetylmuramoyl-L-alanine amidase [Prevotellaceae bacterium]|nr:N-acetylmuramoyl-L-alanine amidase [Prevotellaceae bacterium]
MAIIQTSILSRFKFIIVLVLFLITFAYNNVNAQKAESKIKKIVIDAGHGGKDPGALGVVHFEKNLVLPVALRLGRLIEENLPHIEVIYTRKKDIEVPLHKRSDIANKVGADLFISIHANAGRAGDHETSGYETYVMGLEKSQQNMDVVMRENSVIKYEDNYEEIYSGFDPNSPESDIIFSLMQATFIEKSIKFAEFIQNEFKGGPITIDRGVKQNIFLVLWRTAAPSVLVEIGFISNIVEEQLLADISVQQQIAESIYRAVVKYCNYMDGIIDTESTPQTDSVSMNQPEIKSIENKINNKTDSVQNTQAKKYMWITK